MTIITQHLMEYQSSKAEEVVVRYAHAISGGVSNKNIKNKEISWDEFCEVLKNYEVGEKDGTYFLRGQCDGPRKNENMISLCLVIIDGDSRYNSSGNIVSGAPDPHKVHQALNEKDITHLLVTTHSHKQPEKGNRYRIILPTRGYEGEKLALYIQSIIDCLHHRGLFLVNVKENSVLSQPWYFSRILNEESEFLFLEHKGQLLDDVMSEGSQCEYTSFDKTSEHNRTLEFTTALQSGTIHEAAKKYAGWKHRTSNLTTKQIFDEIGVLIDTLCSNPEKVKRWHNGERRDLERWFEKNLSIEELPEIREGSTAIDLLTEFEVTQEYVDNLGAEEWLYQDLIISCHILVIIAMAGGGKTTFLFKAVVPDLKKKGCDIYYIDADSPASEHKDMKEFADRIGFKLINPNVNQNTGIAKFMETLERMANSNICLKDTVFIFDTLKKFTDLMNKSSVKEFFTLARTLTSKGATCIFAAHANKYRNKEGHLIPEGVGDVTNDADDLILFEREADPKGGLNVTTICDPNLGAKVRGIFKPFSFHIDEKRNVTFLNEVLQVPDRTKTRADVANEEEILDVAEEILSNSSAPMNKTELTDSVYEIVSAGKKRISRVLSQHSAEKGKNVNSSRFVYTRGGKGGAHLFEVAL